jgi:hypothetical protein
MSEIITSADAAYALELIKTICAQAGPGVPGSSQERQRAEIIKKELASHLGSENVQVEEFDLAPEAFLSSQLISTLFMLLAALLNRFGGQIPRFPPWAAASCALILSAGAILIFILEFIFGFELLDPMFKKGKSINVVGSLRRPGTKAVNRLLILSGHHDSAYEFTWLRFTGYGFFFLNVTWMLALAVVLGMNMIQLAGLSIGSAGLVRTGTLGWLLAAYPIVPSILYAAFFTRGRKNGGSVPGAADNLSACGLVAAMCRFLAQNPDYIPADTEIRFITFGSEEAGARGSRRYVARHLDELKRLDARQLNFETIAHPEVAILTSEANGTVSNAPELVKSVSAAAQRAGVPYAVKAATLGTGSDAAPFSRAGLKATTLIGFTIRQMVAFYHQERDTPEVLAEEPLFNVLKLALEWIRSGGE